MSIELILGDYGAKRAVAYREYGDTKTYSEVATKLKIEAEANLKQLILSALPKKRDADKYEPGDIFDLGYDTAIEDMTKALTALFEGEQ